MERWASPSTVGWIGPASPLFRVDASDRAFNAHSPGTVLGTWLEEHLADAVHGVIRVVNTDAELQVDLHVVVYPDTTLVEQWVSVHNTGRQPIRIDRVDSFALQLPGSNYELLSFSSGWGAEFDGFRRPIESEVVLENRSGRSSNGMHPFFVLSHGAQMLSAAIAWSGNWMIRFEPEDGGYTISGGLNDRDFFVDLLPGDELEAPHACVVITGSDLNRVAQQYHEVGRRWWYPVNTISRRLPLEWNHWWSYEDREINEDTFRANVEAAARLGLELCTLDAGWFGTSEGDCAWTDLRGDWDRVNSARFPSGIRSLSDYVHAHGLLFGLWCEIEGLGDGASLGKRRPELVARRDGRSLGYLCFGCRATQDWALDVLSRLVAEYACDWLKLDFNLDPGGGCSRSDHGHAPGDGLLAHYHGYYSVLSRFRERHPEVVLENCSSGGLRTDLGMMQHAHVTFLSDADWPEHNLQVFWGATMMLAPEVCLHWGPSQWLTPHPHQTFDPCDPALMRRQLDYSIRTAMLGAAGFSLRLPNLPDWVAERLAFHARLYKDCIRRFVRDGVLHRLTDAPHRDGGGNRWCIFQYSLAAEHLIVAFRLPGGERSRSVVPYALRPGARYGLRIVDDDSVRWTLGSDLMRGGIEVDWLHEEDSAIIILSEERLDR